jgi:hypothetical protein
MEQQHINASDKIALRETLAEERINLGLRNIDQNLMELTHKLRKPVQQVHYVQENWRRWSRTAFITVGTVAGIWIGYKVVKKVF